MGPGAPCFPCSSLTWPHCIRAVASPTVNTAERVSCSQLWPHRRSLLFLMCCHGTHPRPHNWPLESSDGKCRAWRSISSYFLFFIPHYFRSIIFAHMFLDPLAFNCRLLFTLTHCCQVVIYCSPEQELVKKINELQCLFGARQTSLVEFVKWDVWGYPVMWGKRQE